MRAARILLVEDERIPAFNLQQRLKKLGYEVPDVAASGTAALNLIKRDRPDMILMDIHIEGDMDGIEVAGRIPQELMIPVIYLTAYSEEATLERAAATKPYGYLLKPFSERELHATVQMALERHRVEIALRKSEADLRSSREDFRFLFNGNPLPMWVLDTESMGFLDVNAAALASYGYSREEFLALGIFDLRPPEETSKIEQLFKGDISKYMEVKNWKHQRKNGEVMQVDVFSHALMFEDRRARITVAIDVTERNAAEEQLRQAQKLEAIGHLTGGVAHDFNNLLAIIQGNLELIEESSELGPSVKAMIVDALSAATRGATLTQRLLAYSRQQPLEPRSIAVAQVVSDVMVLLHRTLGESITVEADIAPDVWPIRIDQSQLESALINLAVNARDAMPDGGSLSIQAINTSLDEDYASQNEEVTSGDYVLLTVADSGMGMPPEVVKRAFEPFFTTKPVGRGTGLGLSMVYGFVKQSGGHVKIYSEVGRGTAIKLFLPRASSALDAPVTDHPDAAILAGKGETILVVEDDADVRKLAVTILTSLGYRVLEASDGPSALSLITAASPVDLLLTDVVLPNAMNGPAVASALRALLPNLKVVYMSGYTRDMALKVGSLDDHTHSLMKPFRKAELAAKIRAALEA